VPTFSTGDRVTQPQYGDGTVTMVDQYHTMVYFDAHGSRTFVTSRVQLEQCTSAAPPKPKAAARAKKKKTTKA
jgi:hypothetical protein